MLMKGNRRGKTILNLLFMAVTCKMVRSKRNFLFTLVLKNFYLFNNQELLQSMIISFTLVTLINVRFSGDIMKGYAQFVT